MGKRHFETLFKEDQRENLADIIKLALYFPIFVDEENNQNLYAKVTEAKLKDTMQIFQKDKIPGPYGWSIEFYLVFFKLIGKSILKVIKESILN
jgi:hypothetical protein